MHNIQSPLDKQDSCYARPSLWLPGAAERQCYAVKRAPVRCNKCEPAGDHCKPRINNVGSGAMNVGRMHVPESMIVGREECSIASRAFK